MITLVIPKLDELRLSIYRSMLLGYMNQDCKFVGDNIPVITKFDAFTQLGGLEGENGVDHHKSEGTVVYRPYRKDSRISYLPNSANPYNITIAKADGTGTWATAKYGELVPGYRLVQTYLYNSRSAVHVVGVSDGFYMLVNSPFNRYYVSNWEYTQFVRLDGNNLSVRRFLFSGSFRSAKDWSVERSASDVLYVETELRNAAKSIAESQSTVGVVMSNEKLELTTSSLAALLENQIERLWPDIFPIGGAHWGQLASEASSRLNRNHVNMIAFIRDLRHPLEMVPKLRNLSKLKTLAGNYLSVSYGVLPTISDLKNIWEAAMIRRPFYDKLGYVTGTAGRSFVQSGEESYSYTTSYELEQHLKLAVAKEDSRFDAVISGLDNLGFLPTLQNIWDLVPYSFAIDWFVNIGDILEAVDSRQRLLRFNIRYVTMSRRESLHHDFNVKATGFDGRISRVHYHRWVTSQCPVPPLSLQSDLASFDHWLEAGALIVQRVN